MAYYSGSANSYADVLSALVAACVAEGWGWADGILNKGPAYIRPFESVSVTESQGPGLIIQGGTGKSGSSLLNPSPEEPRMGKIWVNDPEVVWPVGYSIHIFDNPDEVFLVVRFNVDRFMWLSFGVSTVPGVQTGLWLSATTRKGFKTQTSAPGITISLTAGSDGDWQGGTNIGVTSGMPFWQHPRAISGYRNTDAVCCDLDGDIWAFGKDSARSMNAFRAADPLIARGLSAWNQDAPFIPIQCYLARLANKKSLIVDVRNARYLRIDNYDPEQIITLGSDSWKIYPGYRKNSAARNGGTLIDHTGTFGWAIRYDGP
ncbi:hypothetical protein [Ectopseudomonas oleovorans]|uniref:hypothetical protein n=1 Tax=Ectopseudomonas oleovorans TaxID=301 RepID=UPI0035B218E5